MGVLIGLGIRLSSAQVGVEVEAELGNYEDEEAFWEDLGYKMKEAWEHITLLKRTNLKLLLTGRDKGQPVIQSFNFIKLARAKCCRSNALDVKIAKHYHSEQM